MAFLRVPVIFSGPYSFRASVCETYFARKYPFLIVSLLTYTLIDFKRGHLNIEGAATGKKSLHLIKECVVAKAQTIRPANISMYWHHCLVHYYKYLCYSPN